jgi:transposase InsO family protein
MVVDYVRHWSERTELTRQTLIHWIGVTRSKFYNWQQRYGKVNEHNHWIPRDFWLEDWEKQAIVKFFWDHPGQGYRRLTYMMLDADIVAVSPSSVYRVLSRAGLLERWNESRTSGKGNGFRQPLKAHEHWHMDISYINLSGTFYYLCTVFDGFSRYIVHWEIRESMTEADVEIVLQRAKEAVPDAHPQVITDNGSAFIAKDFKEFIRISGMTHVRTSPYYPQSNGKLERWHQSLKRECIRPKTPLTIEDAQRVVSDYVHQYNTKRLHSAIGYITPADKLQGRAEQIFAQRDAKLAAAREERKRNRMAG